MTETDKERIELLEKKRFECEPFSDEHFTVLKELAVLYYKYGLYRDASNALHFLDERNDAPEWVNLHILAINIQLKEIARNYFKSPQNHFFPRLEKISENPEKIEQRNNIFQEALHIFVNGFYKDDFKEIDLKAFYEKLIRFGLNDCRSWKNVVEAVIADKSERLSYFLPASSENDETEEDEAETIETEESKTEIIPEIATVSIEPEIETLAEPEIIPEKSASSFIPEEKTSQKRKKFLIVGYFKGKIKSEFLKKINGKGYGEKDFDFVSDDKASKFLGRIKPFETSYDAVIFGATPHSSSAKGKYASAIEHFQRKEGYPFTVAARTKNKQLKLTLSSLLDAFDEVCTHLEALPA